MFKVPITNEDVPYFKIVAYRDGYSLEFRLEGDDDETLSKVAVVGADEALMEEFLEDVECEKESAVHGGSPVYSLRTVSNPDKLGRLMKLNQKSSYIILKKDEERYLKM